MDFIEVVKKRRAVRKFKEEDVPESLVNELIELANLSPSAGNIQARAVIVVRDKEIINKVKEVAKGLMRFETDIPVLIVILSNPGESGEEYGERGRNLYSLQDATIFGAYLQLAAANRGLTTCWIGYFQEAEVAKILDIDSNYRPIAMIPIGYPAINPDPKQRKSLEEIILKEV